MSDATSYGSLVVMLKSLRFGSKGSVYFIGFFYLGFNICYFSANVAQRAIVVVVAWNIVSDQRDYGHLKPQ